MLVDPRIACSRLLPKQDIKLLYQILLQSDKIRPQGFVDINCILIEPIPMPKYLVMANTLF